MANVEKWERMGTEKKKKRKTFVPTRQIRMFEKNAAKNFNIFIFVTWFHLSFVTLCFSKDRAFPDLRTSLISWRTLYAIIMHPLLGCTKMSKSCRNSNLTWYMLYLYERRPKMQRNDFWGIFLSWPPFCRKCPFYTVKMS